MKKTLISLFAALALVACGQKEQVTLTASGLNPADFASEYNGAPREFDTCLG